MVSIPTCLEVTIPVWTTRKSYANRKINDFSQTQQRTKFSGQISTHHHLERQADPESHSQDLLPKAEDTSEHLWVGTHTANLEKLLEAECD